MLGTQGPVMESLLLRNGELEKLPTCQGKLKGAWCPLKVIDGNVCEELET